MSDYSEPSLAQAWFLQICNELHYDADQVISIRFNAREVHVIAHAPDGLPRKYTHKIV
jgi:hypothetical protein